MLQQTEDSGSQPARRALMPLLSSDGSNGSQIFEALLQLTQTSPMGTQTYLRVLEVHQNSTIAETEAILAVWLQAAELTPADKEAIQAMAVLLGMESSDPQAIPTAVQVTADRLDN